MPSERPLSRIATEEAGRTLVAVLRPLGKDMIIFEAGNFFERGLEIALKEGITIHEVLNAEFHTADERQYHAAQNYVKAKLVSRFSSPPQHFHGLLKLPGVELLHSSEPRDEGERSEGRVGNFRAFQHLPQL